jgi:hypothetical protein
MLDLGNKTILYIEFIEYEGSIVPQIRSNQYEQMKQLEEHLREKGVEVLSKNEKLVIYTKLYTAEEMIQNNVGEFHQGYNIKTFFENFKELVRFIDKFNYDIYKEFLSEEENIDHLF